MARPKIYNSLAEAFANKFTKDPKTGCWNWNGATVGSGYGVLKRNKKNILAHRASWEVHNGTIPDGIFVCHHCDNTRCVNPSHLFLGTHQDNMDDKFKKGRNLYGVKHPNSRKITICNETLSLDEWTARSKFTRHAIRRRLDNGMEPFKAIFGKDDRKRKGVNHHRSKVITISGQYKSISEWATHIGIDSNTIVMRLRRGWPPEKAVMHPVRKHKPRT